MLYFVRIRDIRVPERETARAKTAGIRGFRGRGMNVSGESVYAPPKKIAEKLQHRVHFIRAWHERQGDYISISRSLAAIPIAYEPGYKYSTVNSRGSQRASGVTREQR